MLFAIIRGTVPEDGARRSGRFGQGSNRPVTINSGMDNDGKIAPVSGRQTIAASTQPHVHQQLFLELTGCPFQAKQTV